MTLMELSQEYRNHAQALEQRIQRLQQEWRQCTQPNQRADLARRIDLLTTMLGEARELASLTEHYYQKNFRRNPRYSL